MMDTPLPPSFLTSSIITRLHSPPPKLNIMADTPPYIRPDRPTFKIISSQALLESSR